MSKQWKNFAAGFAMGICVMLSFNAFRNNKEGNRWETQSDASIPENINGEILETENSGTENTETENTETESIEAENAEARNREAEINDYEDTKAEDSAVRISDNIDISQDFVEELLLYQYIEYGLRMFNEKSNSEKQYYVDIRDMLPYDTEFCMDEEGEIPFKTDLAKEMIPQLSNNIYNFELVGKNESIYMSIDTYNMKIYVYDDVKE